MFVSNPVRDEVTCDSFSISLTSSLVGVLLSSGSGICESDGWGELSVCVKRSGSDPKGFFLSFVLSWVSRVI